MKKTLAAVAVLGAFAGSALAADVTLYGKIDAGLNYTHVSEDGAASTDDFAVKSGQNSGSRFGLKGTEQISEGLTVGFQLENGFSVDDGKMTQGGRLFGRQATVYAKTDFGEVAFGRMGGLDSGLGSGLGSDLGSGWGSCFGSGLGYIHCIGGQATSGYTRTLPPRLPAFGTPARSAGTTR